MKPKFPLAAVLLISTLGMAATDFYLPSLPFIQTHFAALESSVQLSLTLFLLGFSLSQFIYGPLSDRFGRRPVILIGLAIGYIGSTICLTAPSLALLNTGRLVEGMGFGAGGALWRTIIRDVYSGEDLARIGAWTASASSISMAIAPILGGVIQRGFGWRAIFIIFGFYTLAIWIIAWKKLFETNQKPNPLALKPRHFFQNYRHLMTNPIFVGYSGAGSIAFAGLSAYFASSPFLFQRELFLSASTYGFLAIFLAAGISIGGVANARLIPYFGRHRLLVLGTILLFLSGASMLFLSLVYPMTVLKIMLPVMLYSTGCAFVFANSFAGAFYPFAHIAGFAGALYGCIQIFLGSVSSWAISFIQETNAVPLSIFFMTMGILAYLFQWIAFRASKKSPSP